MLAAMAYWGVDGAAVWDDGPVGLGCQFCFCTPEETEGLLPYVDEERGWVLTAGGFLANRDELLKELGLTAAEVQRLPDTLLIHRAYRRWGEDCVHHLMGDWHFALWDGRARRLFLARDHCGNTGVCYTRGPGFFAFASSRKALLALPEVPQVPNLLQLAQTLASWPYDGFQTAYAGIYRLPPGHCLRLADGRVKVESFWSAEQAPKVYFPREADYLEAFLEQYGRAVRTRLRSTTAISATLSGGLDSGSVCTLAARELDKRQARLAAFTSIPLEDTAPYTPERRCGDESAFVQSVAAQAGNIDVTWIKAEEISPLAGVERALQIHDEPGYAAANYYWLVALLEQVRKQSFRVLLTGQGGNATVSWPGSPVNLWPVLVQGDWTGFRRQFQELQHRCGLSLMGGIKRFLAAPLVFPLKNRLQYNFLSQDPMFLRYSAIHPGWAHSLSRRRLMRTLGNDPTFYTCYNPQRCRQRRIRAVQSEAGASWGEMSGAYGLEVRDATLDKRLVEFCLGIPEIYHYAVGLDRAVLRRAFHGLLPETVRLNRRRGLQAADICRRLRDQALAVDEAISRLEKHSLTPAVLNLPKMRQVLRSIQQGTTPLNTDAAITVLLRGLGVGMFLLRF
jgi:asparagine synthase (glutamine-hydrolysing)